MIEVCVRPLADYDELTACVELQKETWGARFDDIVSAALMRVSQKIGGVAAGAFEGAEMAGIIFGLTGIIDGNPVHWSHMLAVEPSRQGQGLGRLLKLYQRERMLRIGVRTMYWTFDPLEARNAHFNLNRLKATVDEYVIDMYGSGDSSPLHRGIGTDRFIVRWQLDSATVRSALYEDASHLRWDGETASASLPFGSADKGSRWINAASEVRPLVEIPSNVQMLKSGEPDAAREWRTASRAAITHYLDRGYRVASFARDPGAGRCFYVLERQENDSH